MARKVGLRGAAREKDVLEDFAGLESGFAISEKELIERDRAFSFLRDQDKPGIQREQDKRAVADG